MKLSKYFTLEEFTTSDTAVRWGISNTPSNSTIKVLEYTATKLDLVRELLGTPIIISSAYRCLLLNQKVGSANTSQHIKGEAVDFRSPKYGTPRAIVQAISTSRIQFDQLILEFDSWVHISFSQTNNRNQVLVIDSTGTRPYTK